MDWVNSQIYQPWQYYSLGDEDIPQSQPPPPPQPQSQPKSKPSLTLKQRRMKNLAKAKEQSKAREVEKSLAQQRVQDQVVNEMDLVADLLASWK